MPLRPPSRQRGQAVVELLALLPAIVMLGLIGWQLSVAGHAWTLAGGAARAGARALEVGAPAGAAALAALPSRYAMSAQVATVEDGPDGPRVRVRVAVPRVLPFMPRPGYVAVESAAGAAIDAVTR
jgi:hypothetical protein